MFSKDILHFSKDILSARSSIPFSSSPGQKCQDISDPWAWKSRETGEHHWSKRLASTWTSILEEQPARLEISWYFGLRNSKRRLEELAKRISIENICKSTGCEIEWWKQCCYSNINIFSWPHHYVVYRLSSEFMSDVRKSPEGCTFRQSRSSTVSKQRRCVFGPPMHPLRGLPAHPWRSPVAVVSQLVSSNFCFPMAFYDKWPLTTITKLNWKSGRCSLFWLWEPFCGTTLVPSESHSIFGITLRVQWKALRDPIYLIPRVLVIPGGV